MVSIRAGPGLARPGPAEHNPRAAAVRRRSHLMHRSALASIPIPSVHGRAVNWIAVHGLAVLALACSSPPAPRSVEPAPDMLEGARAELDAGRPREALPILDEAARRAPDDPEVWMLRGRACLATAETDGEAQFYYEDALAAFEKALRHGAGVEARWLAARAARMNFAPDKALDYAHQAIDATASPSRDELRIAAEAAFDCYLARKQAQRDGEELFVETERYLQGILAAEPADLWALVQLANLYQWEGRDGGAVEILAKAVEASPEDEALHQRLIGLQRTVEGPDAVRAHYESFVARRPECALGAWFLAQELFERAATTLASGGEAVEDFVRAEELYVRCRSARPEHQASCLGYEVMCRAGVGWSELAKGDLDAAERAFLAMEDLFEGGLEWQIEDRIASGVLGLQFVADRALREEGGIPRAAAIYARLRRARPGDGDFANNCGFFHREWGVDSVARAREYRRQASSAADPATRDLNAALADEAERRAREILVESRDAYLAAAGLAPDDVRIVNDAALILVYHFPSRHELAEELLHRSARNGEAQRGDPALDPEARDSLLEALGDAYQNLGVLHLLIRKQPAEARTFFDKSFEIGPRPRIGREWIAQVALPACERVANGAEIEPAELDPRLFDAE
jgi:tetratricopeptide (TPR) repeat protein